MSRCPICTAPLDAAGRCPVHPVSHQVSADGWSCYSSPRECPSCADLRAKLAAAVDRADEAEAALSSAQAAVAETEENLASATALYGDAKARAERAERELEHLASICRDLSGVARELKGPCDGQPGPSDCGCVICEYERNEGAT